MPIFLAFIIVAISAIAITYKTYVGYGEYSLWLKVAFGILLFIGWCGPFVGLTLHQMNPSNGIILLTKCLYFLFGFVFFLFVVSFVRDFIWIVIDVIRRAPMEDMKNPPLLQKVNLITIIVCLLVCFYGLYEAEKNATIKSYDIVSSKIKEPTKIVMLSDLHLDVDVSPKYVKNIVSRVNKLNPDAVVIVGDSVDNVPQKLFNQMQELQGLKAKYGVYITLGNHEFYVGAKAWGMKFASMGLNLLNNYGISLGNSGVYLAGIPDINAAKNYGMPIKLENALYNAKKDDYVILLSHAPKTMEDMNSNNVDLVLSGHTHGGQIYPFHYFTKQANEGMLAGFYNKNGVEFYVSRGTRYWGPPMRVLAPSEITVFNLIPEQKDAKPAE